MNGLSQIRQANGEPEGEEERLLPLHVYLDVVAEVCDEWWQPVSKFFTRTQVGHSMRVIARNRYRLHQN